MTKLAKAGAAGATLFAILLLVGSLTTGSVEAATSPAPLAALRELQTSGEPFGIAVDALRGRAYVTDAKENTLFVFDLATGTAVAHLSTGRQPHHIVLAGDRAFVSNFTDHTITAIDIATDRPLQTLAVGGLGLAVDLGSNRLYAAEGAGVAVIDLTTQTRIATLVGSSGANLWGVAVDRTSKRIYVTDIASPRVLVYDGLTNAPVGQIELDAPARFGIALGGAGQLYVASYAAPNAQLSIGDGATARVVARVPLGAFVNALVVDARGLVHAASAVDQAIWEIDPVAARARSRTRTRLAPGGLAIDPSSGALLIATAGGTAPPARLFVAPLPVIRP